MRKIIRKIFDKTDGYIKWGRWRFLGDIITFASEQYDVQEFLLSQEFGFFTGEISINYGKESFKYISFLGINIDVKGEVLVRFDFFNVCSIYLSIDKIRRV